MYKEGQQEYKEKKRLSCKLNACRKASKAFFFHPENVKNNHGEIENL